MAELLLQAAAVFFSHHKTEVLLVVDGVECGKILNEAASG